MIHVFKYPRVSLKEIDEVIAAFEKYFIREAFYPIISMDFNKEPYSYKELYSTPIGCSDDILPSVGVSCDCSGAGYRYVLSKEQFEKAVLSHRAKETQKLARKACYPITREKIEIGFDKFESNTDA